MNYIGLSLGIGADSACQMPGYPRSSGPIMIHVRLWPGSALRDNAWPMQLSGRLAATTLGDVLGTLHRQRTTGSIDLTELPTPGSRTVPGRQHRIHLDAGLVVGCETPAPVAPLGDLLRDAGYIDKGTLMRL